MKLDKLINSLHHHRLPVIFENRNSSDSWVYNGKSIALRSDLGAYCDHDNLHEIGHFIAAHPEQRLFPEYGLELGIVDLGAWGTPEEGFRSLSGILNYDSILYLGDGLVDPFEQKIQEFLAQKIAIFFGISLDFLSAKLLHEKTGPWDTWIGYRYMKRDTLKREKRILQKEVNLRFKLLSPILRSITEHCGGSHGRQ
jgi:hypothetical protein